MIPVLDASDDRMSSQAFAEQLGEACRGAGFFLLTGHDIDPNLIARVFLAGSAFFDLPKEEKAKLSILNNPHNRGWAAQGSEQLDETADVTDRKEAFNVGFDLSEDDPRVRRGDPFRGVNVWPDLPDFQQTLLDYYDAASRLGISLHSGIARDLGLGPGHFEGCFDAPMATLRLLRYPAASGAEGEIGAGAHTDYGSLTLLLTDGEPGLQVKPRGQDWMDVPHVPGAFIVNIGDCLMRWSNDIYVSTPHRVMPPQRQRHSVAFFLDPNPDVMIRALPGTGDAKYPPVTAADYLRSRLDATYVAGAAS